MADLVEILNNDNILDNVENQANEYEFFENKFLKNSGTKAKKAATTQKMDQEKRQAIKMEVATKKSNLLAQESKNRGGKNSRKKAGRIAFVLSEEHENEVPTECFNKVVGIKPDRVPLKRSLRKPGHGDRSGKIARFVDEYSAGSCKFKSFEYLIDIYENVN